MSTEKTEKKDYGMQGMVDDILKKEVKLHVIKTGKYKSMKQFIEIAIQDKLKREKGMQ